MRYFLWLAPFLLSGVCQGQRWQTIQKGETVWFYAGKHGINSSVHFFQQLDSPMLGNKLLRVAVVVDAYKVGSDSIFIFPGTLRDTLSGTGVYTNCIDSLAPFWLGSRMIRKPNGDELYFNSRNDTILLKTTAAVGDTWRITKDASGTDLFGTVTKSGTQVIDGLLDSFKLISVSAKKAGSPVAHYYNALVFEISKYHGFTKTLDLFQFPNALTMGRHDVGIELDANQHIRIPKSFYQDRVTTDIAWRYMPGNEWIIKEETDFVPNAPYQTTRVRHDSVVSFRRLSANSGIANIYSVEYDFYHTLNYSNGYFKDTAILVYGNRYDTVYDDLVTPINTDVEYPWKSSKEWRYYYEPYDSIRGFFVRTSLYYNTSAAILNGCLRLQPNISDQDYISDIAILPDFGKVADFRYFQSPQGTVATYKRFTYIKTNKNTYGQKVNVQKLAVENKEWKVKDIRLFPNPAVDYVDVAFENLCRSCHVHLFNNVGQIVFSEWISGSSLRIPVTSLPNASYVLAISGSEVFAVRRIVVLH